MQEASLKKGRLVFLGCGTAGYRAAEMIVDDAAIAGQIESVTTVDRSIIRPESAITCPQYAGHEGRPKDERLAELIGVRLAGHATAIRAMHVPVANLDCRQLLSAVELADSTVNFVLLGLDCWEARIEAFRRLRRAAPEAPSETLIVQSSFDRGGAQVSVFRAAWDSPCCVCGFGTLPEEEPCVVLTKSPLNGGGEQCSERLLRGDLRRESAAAAAHVCRVIRACLSGRCADYADTKTEFVLREDGAVERFSNRKHRVPLCWGPHDPKRLPVPLEAILTP